MQSGTRIFGAVHGSRANDMKSWFFFARLEADHEWRDFERRRAPAAARAAARAAAGWARAAAAAARQRRGRVAAAAGAAGNRALTWMTNPVSTKNWKPRIWRCCTRLDLVLAVADEALVERRRLLGLRHREVRLVADRVEAGDSEEGEVSSRREPGHDLGGPNRQHGGPGRGHRHSMIHPVRVRVFGMRMLREAPARFGSGCHRRRLRRRLRRRRLRRRRAGAAAVAASLAAAAAASVAASVAAAALAAPAAATTAGNAPWDPTGDGRRRRPDEAPTRGER